MAGEGDFCGLALFPLIIFVFFVSAIAKATRMGGMGTGARIGYGGSYSSYGTSYSSGYHNNRHYGGGYRNNNYMAMQYLAGRSSSNYRPYSPPPSYQPYSSPPPVYGGVPTTGYAPSPPPGYPGAGPATTGYGGAPAGYPPAYAPPQNVVKVSCSYCGSLNPNTERNCMLCGAPMR